MFLSIVLEQRIEARAERALNIGDYDANDVDGEANLGSSDDHDDDDDGSPPPPSSSSSPPTVSKPASKKRKLQVALTTRTIEKGSVCNTNSLDAHALPYYTLASQRRRRLELSIVKGNLPV